MTSTEQCAYCAYEDSAELLAGVPPSGDDGAWAKMEEKHGSGCAWVETRAFTTQTHHAAAGRLGGLSHSHAKKVASRANGRKGAAHGVKGGRPPTKIPTSAALYQRIRREKSRIKERASAARAADGIEGGATEDAYPYSWQRAFIASYGDGTEHREEDEDAD